MNLTFQQAARGVNKEVNLNVTDTCPRCQGNQAEPGTKKVRCHHCQGTGMVSGTSCCDFVLIRVPTQVLKGLIFFFPFIKLLERSYF